MEGVKDKWVSLFTKDFADAKRRHAAVLDQWAGTFDDMRRRRELSQADIAVAVYDHYTTKLAEGDEERKSRPTAEDIDAAFDRAAAHARRERPNADALDMIS